MTYKEYSLGKIGRCEYPELRSLKFKYLIRNLIWSRPLTKTLYLSEKQVLDIYEPLRKKIEELVSTKTCANGNTSKRYMTQENYLKFLTIICEADSKSRAIHDKTRRRVMDENEQGRRHRRYPRKKDSVANNCSPKEKEKNSIDRLLRIRDEEAKKAEKTGNNKRLRSLDLNLEYGRDKVAKTFKCIKCKKEKEYFHFRIDLNKVSTGRTPICRSCMTQKERISGQHQKRSERERLRRQRDPIYRIKRSITRAVSQHISRTNKKYTKVTPSDILEAINKYCGWTPKDLKEHLESLFTSEMNWDNWGKPSSPGEFKWHIDHILPQAKYKYDSLEHENFKKMWSLNNLQPLGARMNIIKSSSIGLSSDRESFRRGIFKYALKNKEYKKGLWRSLKYNNFQAKEQIERTFKEGFSWENHGVVWELDHIKPMVEFPYLTHGEENFHKAWGLNNLEAKEIIDNRTKGGVTNSPNNNEKKIYNFIERK